jgi:hypothetical protein
MSEDSKLLRLMSTAAAARRLRVSYASIKRLARKQRDEFPRPVKVDGFNYFSIAAIEDFTLRASANRGVKRRKRNSILEYIEIAAA